MAEVGPILAEGARQEQAIRRKISIMYLRPLDRLLRCYAS
jgi:hypothetical protein